MELVLVFESWNAEHACNPHAREAERGGSLATSNAMFMSSRPERNPVSKKQVMIPQEARPRLLWAFTWCVCVLNPYSSPKNTCTSHTYIHTCVHTHICTASRLKW